MNKHGVDKSERMITDGTDKREDTLKGDDLNKLIEYLIYHEEDIAIGINDFADLRGVYKTIIGFKPLDGETPA